MKNDPTILRLDLFRDGGFRFDENVTASMREDEKRVYLLRKAMEEFSANEPEVAYQILRELVWQFPTASSDAWGTLALCAHRLGLQSEAAAAYDNAATLLRRELNHRKANSG